MKKIFILTGEPSGDKLAAEVIKNLNKFLIFFQSPHPSCLKYLFLKVSDRILRVAKSYKQETYSVNN